MGGGNGLVVGCNIKLGWYVVEVKFTTLGSEEMFSEVISES